mmetsp:Transcript_82458/g.137932  ORF Transcript_82458/g.137932 Transcript_82458/m.137932 type:complete len:88 (-) Transcript_82458:45-308(-)
MKVDAGAPTCHRTVTSQKATSGLGWVRYIIPESPLDREGHARTKGERFPAQAALENTRPKETSGERLCAEHAGASMGGMPRGRSSIC